MSNCPARAGFTRYLAVELPRSSDHPRSRGVYSLRPDRTADHAGSSPLARGLHPGGYFFDSHVGDHPRSRGVYYEREGKKPEVPGSSPLARGLLFITAWARDKTRIIPARAGFTSPGLIRD